MITFKACFYINCMDGEDGQGRGREWLIPEKHINARSFQTVLQVNTFQVSAICLEIWENGGGKIGSKFVCPRHPFEVASFPFRLSTSQTSSIHCNS